MKEIPQFCVIWVAITILCHLASCNEFPDGTQERFPDDSENIFPDNHDVIASAVLTFAYFDIHGSIDIEQKTVTFEMELDGTDEPDLRYLPVKFILKDGYAVEGTEKDYIRLVLSPDEPADVAFVKEDRRIEYQVCVNLSRKESQVTDFNFKRGVNLSYWFQEDVPWTDDETIEEIAYYGFDHVRLPFDSKVLFDASGDIIRNHLDMLHHVIERCIGLGLNVILDMHWLRAGNSFYEADAAAELVNNWNKLMPEFSVYPVERVAYEILNEPHGYGWENMQRNMVHMIRHYEPARVIFLSPQGYSAVAASRFSVHAGDQNLVVTFHYYEPMLASHRKLWGYAGPSHYPGYLFTEEEYEAMSEADRNIAQGQGNVYYDYTYTYSKMKSVVDNEALGGLRVHCGEFGYSKTNDRTERLQWFKDVVAAFEATGIAYTVWENWGGDFGPGDYSGAPDEEIIDILSGLV